MLRESGSVPIHRRTVARPYAERTTVVATKEARAETCVSASKLTDELNIERAHSAVLRRDVPVRTGVLLYNVNVAGPRGFGHVSSLLDRLQEQVQTLRDRPSFEARQIRRGEASGDVLHKLLERVGPEQMTRFLDQRVRELIVLLGIERISARSQPVNE